MDEKDFLNRITQSMNESQEQSLRSLGRPSSCATREQAIKQVEILEAAHSGLVQEDIKTMKTTDQILKIKATVLYILGQMPQGMDYIHLFKIPMYDIADAGGATKEMLSVIRERQWIKHMLSIAC